MSGNGARRVDDVQRLDEIAAESDAALLLGRRRPLALARGHASRIKHVHIRSVRRSVMEECDARGSSLYEGVEAGISTVPGDRDIEFAPILQPLADADFTGWLVVKAEQDPAHAGPLTYATRARAHLAGV
jgi:inosose dehydratase